MKLVLDPDHAQFAATVDRAFADAGGVALARDAERDPAPTYERLEALLERLGLADLDPTEDSDTMAAAAELCRIAGRHLLPYPLPELLAARGGRSDGVVVVDRSTPLVPHLPALRSWQAVDIDLNASVITGSRRTGGVLSPLTWIADLGAAERLADDHRVATWFTLDAAYTCGALEHALALTVAHLGSREQFGRPLKAFQSLQFRAVDMVVAIAGAREMCNYAAWSTGQRRPAAMTDALAARLSVLGAAREVLRSAHQSHGAIGLTSEHDLALTTRHIQARLRSPASYETTLHQLTDLVARTDFDGLFTTAHPRSTRAPS